MLTSVLAQLTHRIINTQLPFQLSGFILERVVRTFLSPDMVLHISCLYFTLSYGYFFFNPMSVAQHRQSWLSTDSFVFIICEMPCLLGKNCTVVSHFFLYSLEFRVFLLLEMFATQCLESTVYPTIWPRSRWRWDGVNLRKSECNRLGWNLNSPH